MPVGLLILRLMVGGLFVGHGAQKLFGWFGGGGVDGTGQMLASLRYRTPRAWAVIAGLVETVGGAMLVLGLLTPLAAAALIGQMLVAITLVHRDKGPWNTNGGFEFPLTLLAVALALAFTGPGTASLDAALGWGLAGVVYGIGALVLGTLAAGAAVALRQRPAAEAEAREERRAA